MITGAASGIGAAIARKMAPSVSRLILHTHRNHIGLATVVKDCMDQGCDVYEVIGDLKHEDTLQSLVELGIEHQVSQLVLNAGFPDWRNYDSLDEAGFNSSLQVMATANFSLLLNLSPSLRTSRMGRVVAISSFLAHKYQVGDKVVPATSASKAALEALVKSYAAQYARDGICANVIVPGYIKKNAPDHVPPDQQTLNAILSRIPAGRLGQPDEVAELAEFLLSLNAGYITGEIIHINGGLHLK
jgi:NAD(P)-dependent dehydrogenase (short-subunit alcohol dehydrogenase family)